MSTEITEPILLDSTGQDIKNAILQVKEAIENQTGGGGSGSGESVENGGHYIPTVTQPAEDKLQFDFTPSKADMPAVDPVQVTLPVPEGNVDLTGYATEQFVRDGYQPKGNYLTEHQDISGKLDASEPTMQYVVSELIESRESVTVLDNTEATTEAADNSEYFTDDYIVVEKDTYKLDKASMLSIQNKHLAGNGSVEWKDWDTQPQNWKDTEDASMLSSKLKARYADDPVYLSMKLPGEANFVSDTLVRPAMRASNGSGTFTQVNNIGAIMPVDYTKLPDDVVICIGNLSVYTLSRKENARWKLHDKVAIPAGQAMYYLPWATSGDASVQIDASKITVYDDYVRFALKKSDFAPDSSVAGSLAKCLHFWGNHKNLDLADNLAVITFAEVWTETADAVGNLYVAPGCDQKSADKKTISQNFWGRNVLLQTEKTVIAGHNISDALYDELRDTPNDPRNVYADYTESFSAHYDAEQAVTNHNTDKTAHSDIRNEINEKVGDALSRLNQVTDVVQPMAVLTPSININPGIWVHEHLKDDGSITTETWGNPTQWIVSADYIPVTGGRTITLYYDKAEWNSNNNGVSFDMVQYDANKGKISATKDVLKAYINNKASFTLDANTAFIRIGYTNWTDNKMDTALEDIKVAVYYIEDVRTEFLEYGFGSESVYGVPGEKVFFTSPDGKKHTLTVDNDGNVNGAGGGSGGGGVSSWNDLTDKPFYSEFEEVTVLKETTGNVDPENGECGIPDVISLTIDNEYTASWNGAAYKCIAWDASALGMPGAVAVGDSGLLENGEPTDGGEPFVIVALPEAFVAEIGYGVVIMVLDGSESVTVSIKGLVETVTPIPEKYIPAPDWNAEEGQPGHVLNRTHYKREKVIILPETTLTLVDGMAPLSAPLDFVIGDEYEMSVNSYGLQMKLKGTASAYVEEGVEYGIMFVFYDVSGDTDIQAMVCSFNPEIAESMGFPAAVSFGSASGDITVSIYKPERLKKLDLEFVPKHPIPTFDFTDFGILQLPKNVNDNHSVNGHIQNIDEFIQALEDGPVRVKINIIDPFDKTLAFYFVANAIKTEETDKVTNLSVYYATCMWMDSTYFCAISLETSGSGVSITAKKL